MSVDRASARYQRCFEDESLVESCNLGRLDEDEPPEEVPNALSVAAGFRRYCVDGAG